MKGFLALLMIFIGTGSGAQSPYLSFTAIMDTSLSAEYQITMKICQSENPSALGSAFGSDSSYIAFEELKEGEVVCRNYKNEEKGMPHRIFRYGDQMFAFEKIIVLRIFKLSDELQPSMQVVVPVKHQSFVTRITLRDIPFEAGMVLWIHIPNLRDDRGWLQADLSLKGQPYTYRFFPD